MLIRFDRLVMTLLRLFPPALRRRFHFAWYYRKGNPPWDTNQTPPEVVDFVASHPPGRALDLGCGTGTNTLYLAAHGWHATGIDYVAQAIDTARHKADERGLHAIFLRGDVTHLEALPLTGPFDYFLDLGCLHSLQGDGLVRYATQVKKLAAPGATLMVYASFPRRMSSGDLMGITDNDLRTLFAPEFQLEKFEIGTDTRGGWQRGWYWFSRER